MFYVLGEQNVCFLQCTAFLNSFCQIIYVRITFPIFNLTSVIVGETGAYICVFYQDILSREEATTLHDLSSYQPVALSLIHSDMSDGICQKNMFSTLIKMYCHISQWWYFSLN